MCGAFRAKSHGKRTDALHAVPSPAGRERPGAAVLSGRGGRSVGDRVLHSGGALPRTCSLPTPAGPPMTTDYDPIADLYRLAKQQPWRTHVEAFTLMNLVGDPAGKAVLDV